MAARAITKSTIFLVLGVLGLGALVTRADLGAVRTALAHVGWGLALIIGQEIVAHLCNALAWRFTFSPGAAPSFGSLVRLRVAGDAVNYLSPTATLGGEVARVAMLDPHLGMEVRTTSVAVAKFTQTLAQAVFIAVGITIVGARRVVVPRDAGILAAIVVTAAVATFVVWRALRRVRPASLAGAVAWLRMARDRAAEFVREHPVRVAISTALFALGYAWGAFEAYWICRFMLFPVSIGTALAVEVLSVAVDGVLFAVPAKIGTQEGGKVAVFAVLGLPPALGLAFGLVRHVRELVWAGLGILSCPSYRRLSGVFAWRAAAR
ncbi:MAG: flippase-like domain-containing protein [Candidatus Rokubacteria bacterium]|nr:flippase-like domain-containing protein [Candidatus Rokubacteria bacterium]